MSSELLCLLLALCAISLRLDLSRRVPGVSLEAKSSLWRNFWDILFFIGSTLAAFFSGLRWE
ncbi:MAG: hypothetical protein V2I50_12680 [Desulfuromusa sp.]|nr:hypothetical protein [Desulfuromusa sp.]